MEWLLKFYKKIPSVMLTTGLILSSLGAEAFTEFKKIKISVGKISLLVELAESPDQHERGLMFREKMGSDEGMLFIFKNEETRFFWMKNTLIDLSIGYFDAKAKLIDIKEMKSGKGVVDSALPSYASEKPAKYALEMSPGWFAKNKVSLGTQLKIHR